MLKCNVEVKCDTREERGMVQVALHWFFIPRLSAKPHNRVQNTIDLTLSK
jgi:hypothetical protein